MPRLISSKNSVMACDITSPVMGCNIKMDIISPRTKTRGNQSADLCLHTLVHAYVYIMYISLLFSLTHKQEACKTKWILTNLY